jgi:nitroimidazol reductase NimA-like FMN-containing flavoprotein (pyridoxamine 5'-phosphate oxidase superfamily)
VTAELPRGDLPTADVPARAREILDRGTFARLAVSARRNLHLTPLVYAMSGERLWVTTARRSVKALAWERDPSVAGLVGDGADAVAFAGSVTRHDALDVTTWAGSIPRTREIVRASRAFTFRNARFFAGYAVDARRVPLAWTPPGRVFAEIALDRGVVIEDGAATSRWGTWPEAPSVVVGGEAFETETPRARFAFEGVPSPVIARLERGGVGALALRSGARRPVVLPVSFAIERGEVLITVSSELLGAAGGGPSFEASLEVDAGSTWRARSMVGAFLAGSAEVFVPARVTSGRAAALRAVEDIRAFAAEDALLRLHTERVTWWEGWSSGTVARR